MSARFAHCDAVFPYESKTCACAKFYVSPGFTLVLFALSFEQQIGFIGGRDHRLSQGNNQHLDVGHCGIWGPTTQGCTSQHLPGKGSRACRCRSIMAVATGIRDRCFRCYAPGPHCNAGSPFSPSPQWPQSSAAHLDAARVAACRPPPVLHSPRKSHRGVSLTSAQYTGSGPDAQRYGQGKALFLFKHVVWRSRRATGGRHPAETSSLRCFLESVRVGTQGGSYRAPRATISIWALGAVDSEAPRW
ncbi:hypothetical protein NDU88_000204 [Pleurodeles waltl]|uniref:Uncharacterized protein n=1 Tax=Pleurodeles waltl TaxID=8319 RepID=A0AAV7VW61_PLEWA|nr:hypothetical protein NDU88_000204 [Pleurodeles waltl]